MQQIRIARLPVLTSLVPVRLGYAVDEEGVHHVTLESPLTHKDCYGHVDVYADRLVLTGQGDLTSRVMHFPELHAVPATAIPASKL